MFKSTQKLAIATGAALLLVGASSHAVIEPFSQDFEGMGLADGEAGLGVNDLDLDGWEVTGNVFDGDTSIVEYPGNYLYFYGAWYPAPNTGGGGYSAVANDDTSANDIGTKYLNVYNNYDARDAQESGQITNAIIAKQYTISSADIGKTLTFSFDAKRPDFEDDFLGGDASSAAGNNCSVECVAQAFLKTLDPNSNYDTTNQYYVVTTAISQSEWNSYTLELDLSDAALDGQILQIGFESFATNDDNTGVYYDNIVLALAEGEGDGVSASVPIPAIALIGFGALLALSGMSSIRKRLS